MGGTWTYLWAAGRSGAAKALGGLSTPGRFWAKPPAPSHAHPAALQDPWGRRHANYPPRVRVPGWVMRRSYLGGCAAGLAAASGDFASSCDRYVRRLPFEHTADPDGTCPTCETSGVRCNRRFSGLWTSRTTRGRLARRIDVSFLLLRLLVFANSKFLLHGRLNRIAIVDRSHSRDEHQPTAQTQQQKRHVIPPRCGKTGGS